MNVEKALSNPMREACINWTVEDIQYEIDTGFLYGITMLDDGDLYIFYAQPPSREFKSPPWYMHFVIDKSHSAYSRFLSFVSEIKPGETRGFSKPSTEDENWSGQGMRNIFRSQCILKAEYLETGKVYVIFRIAIEKDWLEFSFSPDLEPGAEILKLCGLQKPGDKVYYEEAQKKFDHFLKTGEPGDL